MAATVAVLSMAAAASSRAAQLRVQLEHAPKLGLGMAALGRPGYINLKREEDLPEDRSQGVMQFRAHEVLDKAIALGVRYIDCARSYGKSEEFVSSWLGTREKASDIVTVGSKWGYEYTAGWRVQVEAGEAHEVKRHTAEQLAKQLKESRSLLPQVALYQIHSATEASGVLDNTEVLEALAALRDSQPAVVCGLSVSHPQVATIQRATALVHRGAPLFGAVQATFNLLDQTAAVALEAAHNAGMFVIIKEAVANGRLTSRAAPSARLETLQQEAAALGTTPDALALAWVISHPWVDMCLSGASTVEQLRSNCDALRLVPLPAEVQSRLGEAMKENGEEYWAERRALQWN